jgi:hypothetical protein
LAINADSVTVKRIGMVKMNTSSSHLHQFIYRARTSRLREVADLETAVVSSTLKAIVIIKSCANSFHSLVTVTLVIGACFCTQKIAVLSSSRKQLATILQQSNGSKRRSCHVVYVWRVCRTRRGWVCSKIATTHFASPAFKDGEMKHGTAKVATTKSRSDRAPCVESFLITLYLHSRTSRESKRLTLSLRSWQGKAKFPAERSKRRKSASSDVTASTGT